MLKAKKNNKPRGSKSRNKRITTIYSSQNSILQQISKAASLPLKPNKASLVSIRPKERKQKPRNQTMGLKGHTVIMKGRIAQEYERIPMHFVNSNTNSQIEYSNCGESKQQGIIKEGRQSKKELRIDCDQEALMQQIWHKCMIMFPKRKDPPPRLPLPLPIQQKAATKIQKVFRGYLTRRLLMKYVNQYEEKLLMEKSLLEKKIMARREVQLKYFYGEGRGLEYQRDNSNPLDLESSILAASHREERSLILEESLATHQQASLSFGADSQHSPHFARPSRKTINLMQEEERKPSHYISDDRTGDGFSQNISSCPSYSKPRPQRGSASRVKEIGEGVEEGQLERLRSVEKAKWEQVIQLVDGQLREGSGERTKELMSLILEFSVKNREELSNKPCEATPSSTISDNLTPATQSKLRSSDRPISFKKKKPQGERGVLQRTALLKEHFLRNLSVQDVQVEKMISVREAVLRRKESSSLVELNTLLQSDCLSQDEFLERMTSLTSRFMKDKRQMEQTKEEIYQGYRAQLQLFKSTIHDAQSLGYRIPFCRSMEIYPHNAAWRFDEVMIDELNRPRPQSQSQPQIHSIPSLRLHQSQPPQLSTSKIDQLLQGQQGQNQQIFEQSSEENSANFSYQETEIYSTYRGKRESGEQGQHTSQMAFSPRNMRKASTFNKYSTIAVEEGERLNNSEEKEGVEQREGEEMEQEEEVSSLRRMPKKQSFKIQFSSDQQQEVMLYQESSDKQIEQLVEECFNKLLFDLLQDLLKTSTMIQPFINKGKRLQPVGRQQILSFIELTTKTLPLFPEMKGRLNQKMYPSAIELLVSMRQEDDIESDQEYYQIGHYEYILNQHLCYQAIQTYIEKYHTQPLSQSESLVFKAQLDRYGSNRLKKFVQKYCEGAGARGEELDELRREVVKIELHLVLDAWNQLLIKGRECKVGYSGIGLNEISLSLVDRVSRPIREEVQWGELVRGTREELERLVRGEVLHEKLLKQYQQFVSDNDSQWILYAQQGLQYGFDLAKAVQVQLLFQLMEDLHIINQGSSGMIMRIESESESQSEGDLSQQSEEQLQLNEAEQEQLQKKMERMKNCDSDQSFYD